MRLRDFAERSRRFAADEKTRLVSDLERMISDFEHMALEIDRQIAAEEQSTGVRDKAHFAYSTFAAAAARRRDNLRVSASELGVKLEAAMRDRDEALAGLVQPSSLRRPAPGSRRPPLRMPAIVLR